MRGILLVLVSAMAMAWAGSGLAQLSSSGESLFGQVSIPSRDDSVNMLVRATRFEVGGMPDKPQVRAFFVILEQPNAAALFEQIGNTAQPAGKLYALAGLAVLDAVAAERLRIELKQLPQRIWVLDSDVIALRQVSDVASDSAFLKRAVDDTRRRYAAPKERSAPSR